MSRVVKIFCITSLMLLILLRAKGWCRVVPLLKTDSSLINFAFLDGTARFGLTTVQVQGEGNSGVEVGRDNPASLADADLKTIDYTLNGGFESWMPLQSSSAGYSEDVLYANGVVITKTYENRVIAIAWWFVFLIALLPVPFWIHRYQKNSRRLQTGHCGRCGYDLRATPQRCPECGAVPEAGVTPREAP